MKTATDEGSRPNLPRGERCGQCAHFLLVLLAPQPNEGTLCADGENVAAQRQRQTAARSKREDGCLTGTLALKESTSKIDIRPAIGALSGLSKTHLAQCTSVHDPLARD